MTSEINTAGIAIPNPNFAPYITREKTSMPLPSVPNQWSADGGCNILSVYEATGSCGINRFENKARMPKNKMIITPAVAVGLKRANPRARL
jgi:hypothetical protein